MNTRSLRAVSVVLLFAAPVMADDFDREDFGLRLSSSLTRLSTFPDVVARAGASAASTDLTSVNPAALDWDKLGGKPSREFYERTGYGISGQALDIRFQNDTEMFLTAQSFLFYRPPFGGVARFSFAQIRTNEKPIRGQPGNLDGLFFDYEVNAFRFEWGRRTGDERNPGRHAYGVSFAYSRSETDLSNPRMDRAVRGPIAVHFDKQLLTDVNRDSFSVRLGWQMDLGAQPAQAEFPVRLGAVVDYVYQLTRQEFHDQRFEVEGAPNAIVAERVSAGTRAQLPEASVARHTAHTVLLRGGGAWTLVPGKSALLAGTTLLLDCQWGWFRNQAVELQVHRVYAGFDFPIRPGLKISTGAVADARGNFSWAAGVDFKWVNVAEQDHYFGRSSIDALTASFAYQHDPFPEIGAEFGHSELWALALGFAF